MFKDLCFFVLTYTYKTMVTSSKYNLVSSDEQSDEKAVKDGALENKSEGATGSTDDITDTENCEFMYVASLCCILI